jgi:hypothetical protein
VKGEWHKIVLEHQTMQKKRKKNLKITVGGDVFNVFQM